MWWKEIRDDKCGNDGGNEHELTRQGDHGRWEMEARSSRIEEAMTTNWEKAATTTSWECGQRAFMHILLIEKSKILFSILRMLEWFSMFRIFFRLISDLLVLMFSHDMPWSIYAIDSSIYIQMKWSLTVSYEGDIFN